MPDSTLKDNRLPLSTGKKLVFTLIIISFFLVLVITAGEVIVRLCCREEYIKADPPPPYNTAQKDDVLGWKMTPEYSFSGTMHDAGGQVYDLSLRYDKNGFKAFGDTAATRPKVLFLGDSYTASIEVSNEKSFFSQLADSLGFEAFAYGHAGFGNLQEYLVFDQWVDKIRPDVVVWEVCSNDFIDNYAPLEEASGYKVGERRPYLSGDGEIFYRRPLSFWQKLQEKIIFFQWLEERWDGLKETFFGRQKQVAEYYIATEKRGYPAFDEAVKITEKIVEKMKGRLPEGTKLIAFSADIYQPQLDEFRRIFESNGIDFYVEPAVQVEKAKVEQKQIVKASDNYHWNERGHQIVAGSLAPFLAPLIDEQVKGQGDENN